MILTNMSVFRTQFLLHFRRIHGYKRGYPSGLPFATTEGQNQQTPSKDGRHPLICFQQKRFYQYANYTHHRMYTGLITATAAVVGLSGVVWYINSKQHVECKEEESEPIPAIRAGSEIPELPYYREDDIREHNNTEAGIWVSFQNGVYDITQFVESHPGGKKILLAAGGRVEPFWNMYAGHKNEAIYEMLEEMRIGNVHPEDKKIVATDLDCPYAADPARHPALVINSKKPYDAETPQQLLTDNFLTPNELFYVRNHLPVPKIELSQYALEIGHDNIETPITLTMDELKSKFKIQCITATLQCAGNRRGHMAEVKALKLKGTSGMTAISNAEWTGVKLVDVLEHMGVKEDDYKHVIFVGHDKDIEGSHYEASIPIETAMDPKRDVLLAFQMNGEDLPLDHGYPLRLVVPGTIGARQVKWLKKIYVSKHESQGHWQQNDYKSFHPSVEWTTANFHQGVAIQDYPIQSAICEPEHGGMLDSDDDVTVKGYAWSGGGRGIIRVEVSADGGKTWHQARLRGIEQKLHRQWAWSLFEATIPLPQGRANAEIICKAVDSSHNQQPDNGHGIWNMLGLIHNAWHRISVQIPQDMD